MPLTISDETLKEAGLSEKEAQIEIACRLYDAGKLQLWPAAKFAGLGRGEFEEQLHQRNIAVYRPTIEDLKQDLETLKSMGI